MTRRPSLSPNAPKEGERMALDVREETYPSGAKYRNGGFIPWGCRKALKSERDAQLKVIQRYVAARLGEARKASALFDELGSEV